ncbi:uncharacterized protein LOC117119290 [Anneissia japonica]|uniref:uncharacterized protein LOC117119290 n=1 Tax=Anneissia japonica TaxID=1529436 RepID=UPI0014259EFF|nr:uncharacterized protein LOC117119290 [Anneissia japonica]
MMHIYACFVTLCCVVCVCSGQQKCCINDDLFTITFERLTGWYSESFNLTFEETSFMVNDYTHGRFYVNRIRNSLNTELEKTLVIEDYNRSFIWTIDAVAKTCKMALLPRGAEKPTRCVPGNAQYLDEINLPGDVPVNRWSYILKTPTEISEVTRGYTKTGCIPTGGTVVAREDQGGIDVEILALHTFYNFEVLTDVSKYFSLPSYCNSTYN